MSWPTPLMAGMRTHCFMRVSRSLIFSVQFILSLFRILINAVVKSCCVDEVAAQHVNSDVLVHYGHACMTLCASFSILPDSFSTAPSRTSRLPVLYIFGQKSLNVQACVNKLIREFDSEKVLGPSGERKRILVKHDVMYTHLARQSLSRPQMNSALITKRQRCNPCCPPRSVVGKKPTYTGAIQRNTNQFSTSWLRGALSHPFPTRRFNQH